MDVKVSTRHVERDAGSLAHGSDVRAKWGLSAGCYTSDVTVSDVMVGLAL
jgi:hypothetical protein